MANLESKLSESPKEKSALEKIIGYGVDAVTLYIGFTYYTVSTLLTSAGFIGAYLIKCKKNKQKVTFKGIYDQIVDSSIHGPAGEIMYKGIDFLPNATLSQKIIKTLTFNPGVMMVYQLFYQAQQYIRYTLGYGKTILGVLNPKKGKEYLKHFYETKLKGQYFKKVRSTFLSISPIHFASINYITKIWQRMIVASFNDLVFAMISKPEEKKEKYTEKLNTADSYKTNELPNYKLPNSGYADNYKEKIAA